MYDDRNHELKYYDRTLTDAATYGLTSVIIRDDDVHFPDYQYLKKGLDVSMDYKNITYNISWEKYFIEIKKNINQILMQILTDTGIKPPIKLDDRLVYYLLKGSILMKYSNKYLCYPDFKYISHH